MSDGMHLATDPDTMYRDHSIMLGQIASEVTEWCGDNPEATTLEAVQLMKAELFEHRAWKLRSEIWAKWERMALPREPRDQSP